MKHLCVTLETARRLKAAGWEKETAFVWAYPRYQVEEETSPLIYRSEDKNYYVHEVPMFPVLPAPTLGEIVRELIQSHGCDYFEMPVDIRPLGDYESAEMLKCTFHAVYCEGEADSAGEGTTPEEAAAEAYIALQEAK